MQHRIAVKYTLQRYTKHKQTHTHIHTHKRILLASVAMTSNTANSSKGGTLGKVLSMSQSGVSTPVSLKATNHSENMFTKPEDWGHTTNTKTNVPTNTAGYGIDEAMNHLGIVSETNTTTTTAGGPTTASVMADVNLSAQNTAAIGIVSGGVSKQTGVPTINEQMYYQESSSSDEEDQLEEGSFGEEGGKDNIQKKGNLVVFVCVLVCVCVKICHCFLCLATFTRTYTKIY